MSRYDRDAVSVVSKVVKAVTGKVRAINVVNTDSGALTFQLFDKATAPTSTSEVPVFEWVLAAGAHVSVGAEFFGVDGVVFHNGIAWGTSTTKNVYTANGSAKLFVAMLYN